jgi:hypothetical protein
VIFFPDGPGGKNARPGLLFAGSSESRVCRSAWANARLKGPAAILPPGRRRPETVRGVLIDFSRSLCFHYRGSAPRLQERAKENRNFFRFLKGRRAGKGECRALEKTHSGKKRSEPSQSREGPFRL